MSLLFGLLWAATGWFVPMASEEERQRWKDLDEAVMDEQDISPTSPDELSTAKANA
jgi:NhaC family Na+:H+ antiporter